MSAQVVVIEHRDDIPGGLPAAWITGPDGTRLYLRADLPEHLRQHFLAMCSAATRAA